MVGLLASAVYYLASLKFQIEEIDLKMDNQRTKLLSEINPQFTAVNGRLDKLSEQMQEVCASLQAPHPLAGRVAGRARRLCGCVCSPLLQPCVPANNYALLPLPPACCCALHAVCRRRAPLRRRPFNPACLACTALPSPTQLSAAAPGAPPLLSCMQLSSKMAGPDLQATATGAGLLMAVTWMVAKRGGGGGAPAGSSG